MIEVMENLPETVVGFRASGNVTKEDYDQVLLPKVKEHVEAKEPLNYVMFIDTPVSNFSVGAWIMDSWLSLKEIWKWKRFAIVSDEVKARNFTDSFGHMFPGEYAVFTAKELQHAVEWAAGKSSKS
jgi:hypothetical protein